MITQDSMTVDDIEVLLKDTEHNGYPVVVSRENQYLVGFILRKDLNLAIGESQYQPSNFLNSPLIFSQQTPKDLSMELVVNRW